MFCAIRSNSIRSMSIFMQCLNPLTGTPTWEEKDQCYDYHQEIARSAFADMLHDSERNQKYYIALKAAIDKKHKNGEEANVLDIGTGTGLLSMMAAKCGADSIVACEAFTPMAKCALTIIKENGYENRIKLVQKRSTKMTVGENGDMKRKANILVTEVFDTELIGEGALSTFRHAHEKLLEKNSIVVPSSATVWVQVVESSFVDSWNRIKPIIDTDNNEVLIRAPPAIKQCAGAAAVHDIQLTRLPHDSFKTLLPPQPIFRFDWTGREPLVYDEKVTMRVQAIADGAAQAVFMWWELNMDMDGQIILSCAPVWEHPETQQLVSNGDAFSMERMADLIPWRDHWMQAIYYLPTEISIKTGTNINLIGYHDEYSFWFQLTNQCMGKMPDYPRLVCNCGMHVAYSRTRIGQLNDENRNKKYIKALKKKIKPNSVCLCLSEGCSLGLAAAQLGARKIYMLELNSLCRRTIEMFINQNGLSNRVQIIESLNDLPSANGIDFIFGEPFFIGSIVPWENLRFWYLCSKYHGIKRIPIAATIRGVIMEFKDLYKIRAPLGICEGFDLSSFDKLVQASSDKTDNPVEAQPLWEYPGTALSLPFDIVKFDLTESIENLDRMQLQNDVPILRSGSYNGVALWIDWHLDAELTVSSGPTQDIIPGEKVLWDPFTRQGVHLVRHITDVTDQDVVSWSFSFTPEDGDIGFHFDISSRN